MFSHFGYEYVIAHMAQKNILHLTRANSPPQELQIKDHQNVFGVNITQMTTDLRA
jgi:hypothetical protein